MNNTTDITGGTRAAFPSRASGFKTFTVSKKDTIRIHGPY